MATEIIMPKLSDTMEEGTILEWRVKEGDAVRQGEIIAEVETDKAAMEMEAWEDGVISRIAVVEGETVPVGTVIAVLDGPVATAQAAVDRDVKQESFGPSADREPADAATAVAAPQASSTAEAEKGAESAPGDRRAVSPLARKKAGELGVDLTAVRGSGPGGRVVARDVEAAAGAAKAAQQPPEKGRGKQKSVRIRRIMARKMTEGWTTIPHFYVTYAIDMTDVIRFRKDLGVTINDFVLTAVARSLHEHPWVNSWWVDGEAVEQPQVNIAMAVSTERGLYNPVLKDCARLSLKEISRRAAALAEKAHQYRLAPEDLEDGTFTISNMGMLGVESFRAIITPPQAAVLAVGTVRGEVVVDENGEPAVAPIARMTLAADHRILDGVDAAEFMLTLKSYLEAPVTLVSCDYGEDA
ncbi:pyruvate dehydrogenase E2 component (dihydrolipoamide acetyltransferase) [Geothermobacter ehrlichii]|uniref:Dihydrolipoamide acetyltransferase component of pyruvate dehydrogenase complex n=1 Tax=Geothermobacter ehrlichii TaxID=213224 RepID=A0A5D3WH32_9BACT|nr:dihydrolipoamide acetyltransferase family protein [Geothermobacter ehrlichii]TYO95666.1 pyruvate dehydrogenase E2 component (dihydrolipoamide acetyltransferase) [Geothermobacter ehrlichii]